MAEELLLDELELAPPLPLDDPPPEDELPPLELDTLNDALDELTAEELFDDPAPDDPLPCVEPLPHAASKLANTNTSAA